MVRLKKDYSWIWLIIGGLIWIVFKYFVLQDKDLTPNIAITLGTVLGWWYARHCLNGNLKNDVPIVEVAKTLTMQHWEAKNFKQRDT